MSQGCTMLILRSKGQRLRSWGMVNYKCLLDYNWLCNQPMIMKLHTLTPHESRMHPADFEVKGQGHGAMMIENGFRAITDTVIHLWSWNFIRLLPWVKDVPYWFRGQRSRSWGISDWKQFLDHNWLCNPPIIMKLHTPAPYESRMCLINFGVKVLGYFVMKIVKDVPYSFKGFLQLGFLHLWCTLYFFDDFL